MTYSGFLRRLCALVIDGLILVLPGLVISGGWAYTIAGGLGVSFVLGLIYQPVFESSVLCATPGKSLMGMVVLSESGDRLTFKAACIRYVCRYISFATCYIGYVMQLFTKKRQTLHDMIAEAVVVDRQSPDLNYFTVWLEQFKQVVNSL